MNSSDGAQPAKRTHPTRATRCPVIHIALTHSRVNDGGGDVVPAYAPTPFTKKRTKSYIFQTIRQYYLQNW
jgi:hypothetical protein